MQVPRHQSIDHRASWPEQRQPGDLGGRHGDILAGLGHPVAGLSADMGISPPLYILGRSAMAWLSIFAYRRSYVLCGG